MLGVMEGMVREGEWETGAVKGAGAGVLAAVEVVGAEVAVAGSAGVVAVEVGWGVGKQAAMEMGMTAL
jgi:hypothetical protein